MNGVTRAVGCIVNATLIALGFTRAARAKKTKPSNMTVGCIEEFSKIVEAMLTNRLATLQSDSLRRWSQGSIKVMNRRRTAKNIGSEVNFSPSCPAS
jgi:hypothetical protein